MKVKFQVFIKWQVKAEFGFQNNEKIKNTKLVKVKANHFKRKYEKKKKNH